MSDIASNAEDGEVDPQSIGSPVQFFNQDSNVSPVHFEKDQPTVDSEKSVADYYRHPSRRKDGGHDNFEAAAAPVEDDTPEVVKPAKAAAPKK